MRCEVLLSRKALHSGDDLDKEDASDLGDEEERDDDDDKQLALFEMYGESQDIEYY
jgi:hypothetical protein